MQAITEAAHDVGAYAGFDLAHAAGNIALQLHDWNVDFACWCTLQIFEFRARVVWRVFIFMKSMHPIHLCQDLQAGGVITKETRFKMEKGFDPIPTAEGWQLSNAPVLSMAAHKASLDIFEEAGMETLLEKSKQLTGYLFFISRGDQ